MLFGPTITGTPQTNVESETVARMPLHVTELSPESASLTAPVTVTSGMTTGTPSPGKTMSTAGGVLSRLTNALVLAGDHGRVYVLDVGSGSLVRIVSFYRQIEGVTVGTDGRGYTMERDSGRLVAFELGR